MEKITTKTIRLCKAIIVFIIMTLFLNNGIFAQSCSPPGAMASVSDTLTCGNNTVMLSGESPTSGVTYHWDGPDDFESGLQDQIISIPGTYKLTVTNPVDGCTSVDSVEVYKDIEQPYAEAIVNDTLDCLISGVTLQGNTNVANAEFHWIGPGSYSVYEQNPQVSVKGGYTLIVTDPNNECASTATAYVEEDRQEPLASAYVSGSLICTNNSVELTSSSPTSRVLYSWSGAGISNPNQQNTAVTEDGICTVTVTDTINACFSVASVEVIEDREEPGALITSTAGEITCETVNATLTANSFVPGVTYSWTSSTGYTSTVQNTVVATPADYYLEATRAVNGCVSRDTFKLGENKVRPLAVASPSGELTCSVDVITLLGSSSSGGMNYLWRAAGFISNLQNPTTSNKGTYMLIVKDPNNGCTSSTFTSVKENKVLPASVTVSNEGPITCIDKNITLSGNSSTPTVKYSWIGTNFTSTEQYPIVSNSGTYYLTVTDTINGCKVEQNTTVAADTTLPTSVTAANAGDLTCIVDSVNLLGNSTTNGMDYSWTGPGSFSSILQNPSVEIPGTYYLTVTNPSNECYVVDSTVVKQDTISPANVIAGNDGPIICGSLSVALSGNSTTTDVIYNWTGPNNYTSTSQNPTVGIPGLYILTVKNTINNCVAIDSTELAQDTISPKAVTALNDGPLTCSNKNIALTGNTSSARVIYSWKGPGTFTSDLQNPVITVSGTYSLTVKDTVNECSSTVTTIVAADTLRPVAVNAINDGPITCADVDVRVIGSSSTSQVLYSWTGPGNFAVDSISPLVDQSGTYFLTVTDSINGCFDIDSTEVLQDVDLPTNVEANNNGPLICSDTIVTLTASSSTGGLIYSWTGPGNFSSELPNPSVSKKGTYELIATNPENGCDVTTSTFVDQDTVIPGSVLAVNNGPLTCADTIITLTASSSTPGVSYSWTGPGFTSIESSPEIEVDGTYKVVITHPINGCVDSASTVVGIDVEEPQVLASVNGIFTCNNESLTITAESPTSEITYSWTGPGNFSSTKKSPEIFISDTYSVTVTDTVNGCTSSSSITTQQDTTSPGVIASIYDTITCDVKFVTMQASSLPGIEYSWTGPDFNSTEQYPVTTQPGDYEVIAKDPNNGCISVDSLTVLKDTLAPADVTASVSGDITCVENTVTLIGESSTSGVDYSWQGVNFSSQNQNAGTDDPGNYRLIVTNPVNGCFDTASVIVFENKQVPQGVSATTSSMLNCEFPFAILTANTTTENVGYQWSGPGFSSILKADTITESGGYTLTVTDTINGCVSSDFIVITKDIQDPTGINAFVSGELTCSDTIIVLSASSSTSGVEYSWIGPDGFVSSNQNPGVTIPGDFTVTITDPDNGCDVERILTVEQDTAGPVGVSASVSADLTCTRNTVYLSSAPTTGVDYFWSSPAGFTSTIANPPVVTAGEYTLVITNQSNGCSETRIVTVVEDRENPTDVTASIVREINCSTPQGLLKGTTTTTETVNYEWFDEFGFSWGTEDSLTTFFSGEFVLVVSNPVNGCSASDTVVVTEDRVEPNLVTSGNTITCNDNQVVISANSSVPNVTYDWSGPGITGDTTLQNQTVSVAGEYDVIVFNPANGCFSQSAVIVGVDTISPDLTAEADGILTCDKQEVELTASSTPGIIFTWTGYGIQNPITVTDPDEYIVTALNSSNGCTKQESVIVEQDTAKPDISTSVPDGDHLTCNLTSVRLVGETTSPNANISWIGFTQGVDTVNVMNPGTYLVTAKDNLNGCSSFASVDVTQNINPPADVEIIGPNVINCIVPNPILTGSTSTNGAGYSWSDGLALSDSSIMVFFAGDYQLVVTRPDNGCSDTVTATIISDNQQPVCNIIPPSSSPIALLNDSISCQEVSDVTYSWSITSSSTWSPVSGADSPEFIYTAGAVGTSATFNLYIRDTLNGCDQTCSEDLTAVTVKSAPEFTEVYNLNDMQVDVYPNPFSDKVWIEFASPEDEHVTISIYSVDGQLLETLFDSEVNHSDKNKLLFDGSSLAQGTYYCTIVSGEKVYTRKLLLVR